MEIRKVLKRFRENNKQTQEEASENRIGGKSNYSKIETGRRNLYADDLEFLVTNLSVSGEEFIHYSNINDKQDEFNNLFFSCYENKENENNKKKLINYYFNLEKKEKLTTRDYSNLISIKSLFSDYWEEIEKSNKVDTSQAFNYLIQRKFFT